MAPRPEVFEYTRDNCSVGRAMEVLGERWSLLVIREAFFGVRRFADFQRTVGCAKNLLSDRLGKLVAHGVLARLPYRDEGQRERFEYRPTEMGLELMPILVGLMQWGDKWLGGGAGPIEIHHRGCGCRVHAEVRCAAGHGPLGPRDTEVVPTARAVRR